MTDRALELLRHVFGYDSFRGEQAAVVGHVTAGGDALVLMPTGGGKSLCYQLPALLREGTAIVVSPLIALMQDQVEALRQLGVRAAFLNSSLAAQEAASVERQLLDGDLDLLYVAPERLLTPRFLSLLDRSRVALFAIDEAHCVSQWGHDFRPEYRQLALLHERWPRVPRIALTATADAPTRGEIVERLSLQDARQFVGSFDRPNIRYHVVAKHDGKRQLLDFLVDHAGDSGIVYCLSRRKVEATAQFLAERGIVALPYHAGLDAATRAPPTNAASCARTAWSWSRRSPSAWASTSRTCASSPTSTCPSRWRATTRRPAAPAATARRPPPGCVTASATRCCCGG
jgi:ATP-dependent DNA helicase RecQ